MRLWYALQQQREWFEVTLASIGDAVITTDVQGNVTYLNPVAESMTGWSSAEAGGAPLERVFCIVNEDTRQTVENPIGKVLQTGKIVGLANHSALINRHGTLIPIEDSAAPIRDAQGKISGAVMVFHDVTQRRRAEDALRANEERLRATFNQAAVGIFAMFSQVASSRTPAPRSRTSEGCREGCHSHCFRERPISHRERAVLKAKLASRNVIELIGTAPRSARSAA
jgi:PAS domain S-box-containing protein